MSSPAQWTTIARILRPQGRKGEVLAEVLTDFPERFADRKELHLRTSGETPQTGALKAGGSLVPIRLASHWFPTGKSAGKVVLHFEGIDTITAAEALSRSEIVIPDADRTVLEEGTYYVDDLIGCTVVETHTQGTERAIGIIRDVHFPTDTHGKRVEHAAPILVIDRPNGDELLVPLAKDFLHRPDLANKRIEMRLPDGLLEING